LKKPAKVAIAAGACLIILGGGIAANSDAGRKAISQVAGESLIPDGCQSSAVEPGEISFVCTDVVAKDVLKSSKIATASRLAFEKAEMAGADFSKLDHLIDIGVFEPKDPDAVAAAVSTAPHLESLGLVDYESSTFKDLQLDTDVLFINNSNAEAVAGVQPVNPELKPKNVVTDAFLGFSTAAAQNISSLTVGSVVETDELDLSGYTVLETLTFTVADGTEVELPQHVTDDSRLQITKGDGVIAYSL